MRRLSIIASLAASCTFSPPSATFVGGPTKDAGAGGGDLDASEPETGVDGGAPDGGRDTDGGENTAPIANAGVEQQGIPWDTFSIDGSGSIDQDGDPLTFTWTVETAPTDSVGGFAPFPGVATATIATTAFYADRAGRYVLRLEVSDGELTTTATTTIEIAAFEMIPPPPGGAAGDTIALAASEDRLFMGVKPQGGRVFDLMTMTSSAIDCTISDKINAIAIGPDGRAWYAFDDSPDLIRIDGTSCSTIEGAEEGGPSKVTDVAVTAEGDAYLATDRDVYRYSGGEDPTQYTIDAIGNDSRYKAVAIIDGAHMWLGSDEAGGVDGAVLTTIPPSRESPVISFFPGDDKVTSIAAGLPGETWIATEVGIVRIPDVDTATRSQTFATGAIPSPLSVAMLDVAFDPGTGDAYFAAREGIARYKRDVGAIVAIPKGTSGLTDGDVRAVAFAFVHGALIVGNQNGAFIARP